MHLVELEKSFKMSGPTLHNSQKWLSYKRSKIRFFAIFKTEQLSRPFLTLKMARYQKSEITYSASKSPELSENRSKFVIWPREGLQNGGHRSLLFRPFLGPFATIATMLQPLAGSFFTISESIGSDPWCINQIWDHTILSWFFGVPKPPQNRPF